MSTTPILTIIGGSGFLGRYIVRRAAKAGWRVRVACRRPEMAGFVRTYGTVGQVEPVFANIRDDDSIRAVTRGAQAVVNCVGILSEVGKQEFGTVQAEGAARAARIAAQEGVARFVQISAIGADAQSESEYARSKATGEEAVRAAFPSAVILRPSILFGEEDGFFNRFAAMSRMSPVLPLVGADTKFQPVYADDVAKAAVLAIEGKAASGIYELGGPEIETFRALMERMLKVIRRRRLLVALPFGIASIIAWKLDAVQFLTAGLLENRQITRDQVKLLRSDNVVASGANGFAELGIEPTGMAAVLDSYLYRYRPYGQYTDLIASRRDAKP